jgi:hypothetical protein
MSVAVLWLGFLLGLRHALDADHVATVASLSLPHGRIRDTLRVAVSWGLGHAVVLLACGTVLYALRATLPPSLDRGLEIVVAVTLIVLGLGVLVRLRSLAHALRPRTSRLRAGLIGGVHGMQGSAALVILALPAAGSLAGVAGYLAVFGLGSIVGMLLCSLAIALPLHASARLHSIAGAVQATLGVGAVAVGIWMIVRVTYARS